MDQVLAPHSLRDRHGRGICVSAMTALTGCASFDILRSMNSEHAAQDRPFGEVT